MGLSFLKMVISMKEVMIKECEMGMEYFIRIQGRPMQGILRIP